MRSRQFSGLLTERQIIINLNYIRRNYAVIFATFQFTLVAISRVQRKKVRDELTIMNSKEDFLPKVTDNFRNYLVAVLFRRDVMSIENCSCIFIEGVKKCDENFATENSAKCLSIFLLTLFKIDFP